MTDPAEVETPRQQAIFSSERAKTFVDAVVAIAMTLLILPLLETVAHAKSAESWVDEHSGQLIGFVLSFLIVARFWISHHRMFSKVERVNGVLLWLLVLWMATIVWLPVPTAMSSTVEPSALLFVLYIGSMIVTSLATLAIRLVLRTNPSLHDIPPDAMARGLSADVIALVLFAVALVIAILTPVGYYGLFILVLIGPLQVIAVRALRIGARPAR